MIEIKEFNIVVSGIGGQGIITLTKILSQAALEDGYNEIRTSELHGLSQRGGSVETHIRFGKDIYSPLLKKRGADLIFALELREGLRMCSFSDKERTVFLANDFFKPLLQDKERWEKEGIKKEIKKQAKRAVFVPPQNLDIPPGIFLLGIAFCQNLIPLSKKALLKALKICISKEYLKSNIKAFELAKSFNIS